jgi:LytR cell envelope-related transcriptional attenuator
MAGMLLLGAGMGVIVLSLVLRSREPALLPPADPDLSIEVLNGCGTSGAGERVAMLLRGAGYRVDAIGNADHFHYREDIVIARRVSLKKAEPVARLLGGANVIEQRRAGHPYDITIVVGKVRSLAPETSNGKETSQLLR